MDNKIIKVNRHPSLAAPTKSCLTCKKITTCKDPHKSQLWSCDQYRFNDSKSGEFLSTLFQTTITQEAVEKSYVSEKSLEEIVDSVLATSTGVPRDIKIDDSSLIEFPNFFQFATSSYGLNILPYPRQMAIALYLFAEICPRCSNPQWVKDRNIENIPLSYDVLQFPEHLQILEFGVCPKCKATKRELIKSRELYQYNEAAICVGQRAGKSAWTSMVIAYLIHKYLKLQRPNDTLGLLPNSTLTGTTVALTYDGAIQLLWNPVKDLIEGSKWFTDCHELLRHYEVKYGCELLKTMDTFIHYKHKNMFLCASGPNKRTLRGKTRLFTAIDEIGWFDSADNSDKVKLNADEIYKALDRSLLTVRSSIQDLIKRGFNSLLPGYAFNISSPSHARDKIMTLVNNHSRSRYILAVHLPTWKFNPRITRKSLKKEFDEDPIKAERDFGANPPMSDSPFIENQEIVENLFSTKPNRVKIEYIHKKNKAGQVMRAAKVVKVKQPSVIRPAIMALDAGYSNNSFALVIGHRTQDKKAKQPYIFDTLVEVSPGKEKTPLNYTKICKELIFPLINLLNVRYVFTDRWQSIKLRSDIEEDYPYVGTESYSVTMEDFFLYKSHLEANTMVFPRLEMKVEDIIGIDNNRYPNVFKDCPVSHFFLQNITVNEGRKTVEKGSGGMTDDLFRAAVLAFRFLSDNEWCNEFLRIETKKQGTASIGVMSGHTTGLGYNSLAGQAGNIIASSANINMNPSQQASNIFARIQQSR